MKVRANSLNFGEIGTLLRGQVDYISSWMERWNVWRFGLHVIVIIIGAGFYGAAMGWWRDPQQAIFVAIKFPLIILLTIFGNSLINVMLAPLIGLDIPFRQSFLAILMSFTIASAILGAFSPIIAFMVWNTPGIDTKGSTYCVIMLAHVAAIALAGIIGNARLFQLLVRIGKSRTIAFRVLIVWLAGNLFLGSQLSWILRPFIGSPDLPVEFLRANAFHGNFYEAVLHSWRQIFNG
ncbi:MAG TPA: hypothetical protein VFV23_04390 [Verrucomicrobiae bacterium]|nr:hypothetical protein [Verrucomicrobiae bacterium]